MLSGDFVVEIIINLSVYSLLKQVQKKQTKIVSSQNDLAETEDRINAMVEHLKNVRQELQHTQVGTALTHTHTHTKPHTHTHTHTYIHTQTHTHKCS